MRVQPNRPITAWTAALWIAAPAATCTLALGLDHGAFGGRDALAGLALGALAAGARYTVRRARWPWGWTTTPPTIGGRGEPR